MESILASLTSEASGKANPLEPDHDPASATVVGTEEEDDDIKDVMEVLTDLAGDAFAAGSKPVSSATEKGLPLVHDVSKVEDKSPIRQEEDAASLLLRLNSKQAELEQRFERLGKRVNHLRVNCFGAHVVRQLQHLRSGYVEQYVPAPALPTPSLPSTFVPAPADVLPFLPRTPIPPLPTAPVAPESLPEVNKKRRKRTTKKAGSESEEVRRASTDNGRQQLNDVVGRLKVNLRHLVRSYDSDATESSSGGESCGDEMEGVESETAVDVTKRPRYVWLRNRAGIASRWTWLTAQIADLEYRIRQQTELYRQIRNVKGAVVLGDGGGGEGVNVTENQRRIFELNDEKSGRKIVVKGPSDPPCEDDPHEPAGVSRTRPINYFRRRCLFSTGRGHGSHAQAAAAPPQPPEPLFQSKAKTASLLDHSYHQVLSRYNLDIPVDVALAKKLKDRSWVIDGGDGMKEIKRDSGGEGDKKKSTVATAAAAAAATATAATAATKKKKKKKKRKKRLEEELEDDLDELMYEDFAAMNKKSDSKRRNSESAGSYKKRKLMMKRSQSVTVHNHSDGSNVAMMHDINDDLHPACLTVPSSQAFTMEQIRRRRETAFDIDDIVIPYSTMASARVERLKYKEIQTPCWRTVEDVDDAAGDGEDDDEEEEEEDNSDQTFVLRHAKAELEEQARWKTPFRAGAGGNNSRSNRRQLSADSGCNTPDPLSPGVVERVDTLEVTTRPSTPTSTTGHVVVEEPGSIRNRRRTSSSAATVKSSSRDDRNPSGSGDLSRCTTPLQHQQQEAALVRPYDARQFPMTEAGFEAMLQNVEHLHSVTTVYAGGGGGGGDNNQPTPPLPLAPPPPPPPPPTTKSILKSVGTTAAAAAAATAGGRRVSLSSASSPNVIVSGLRTSRDSSIEEEDDDDDDDDVVDEEEEEEEIVDSMDEDDEDFSEFLEDDDEEEEVWLEEDVDNEDPDDPEWDVQADPQESKCRTPHPAAAAAAATATKTTSKKINKNHSCSSNHK